MRIALLGAGNIGTGLGRKWTALGHIVVYGVRDPSSPKLDALKAEKAKIMETQEAVNTADVVVLAVPFQEAESLLKSLHGLTLKILIDATNAVSSPLPKGYVSAAEAIAAWSNCSKVVKAFNSTGVDNLKNPLYNGQVLETFLCGNDTVANALVSKLAEDIGFKPIDIGKLDQAYLLEALAKLWISLAYKKGMGPDFAFKLIQRQEKNPV
jgi:NADPH-dependent F420 reductase